MFYNANSYLDQFSNQSYNGEVDLLREYERIASKDSNKTLLYVAVGLFLIASGFTYWYLIRKKK